MELLDVKTHFDIPDIFEAYTNVDPRARKVHKGIWEIVDFLTEDECDHLISITNTVGYTDLSHQYEPNQRDSTRVIGFDPNGHLRKTIEARLKKDCLPERLSLIENHIVPYGTVNQIQWSKPVENPVGITINPCFRFHHYVKGSGGFEWHRDSQVTFDDTTRSNFTMLIYLTSNTDAKIEFKIPTQKINHVGLTVQQELKIIGADFKSILLTPIKGSAIIFDQRYLHLAHPLIESDHKYVLRTDLMCHGQKLDQPIALVESQVNILTRQLFRQAQFYELLGNKEVSALAGDLYSICLSLRQSPETIKSYENVKYLEFYLTPIPFKHPIEVNPKLRLISRSGKSYNFSIDDDVKLSTEKLIDAIKVAGLATFLSWTNEITSEFQAKIREHHKQIDQLAGKNRLDRNQSSRYYVRPLTPTKLRLRSALVDIKSFLPKICHDRDLTSSIVSDEDTEELENSEELEENEEIEEIEYSDNDETYENIACDGYISDEENFDTDNVRDISTWEAFCDEQVTKYKNAIIDLYSSDLNQFSKEKKTDVGLILSTHVRNYNIIRCTCFLGDSEDHCKEHGTIFGSQLRLWPNLGLKDIAVTIDSISKISWIGKLKFIAMTTPFNHASCQCEGSIDLQSEHPVYQTVTIDLTFTYSLKSRDLTIHYVPRIVI